MGPTTVFVYDALGLLALESSSGGATPACTTCYLSYDYLGSVRMVTDANGQVVGRHEYLPYGEEIPGGSFSRSSQFGASEGVSQRFTGQERDAENTPSLDYFNARYMSLVLGRFMSADPGNAGANLYNPQSWNGYSYVWINPLSLIDPTGMSVLCVTDMDGNFSCYDDDPQPSGGSGGAGGGSGGGGVDIWNYSAATGRWGPTGGGGGESGSDPVFRTLVTGKSNPWQAATLVRVRRWLMLA